MSVFIQPIYTQTVGAGGAANIFFNNIPQGFTDLLIVGSTRSSSANPGYNDYDINVAINENAVSLWGNTTRFVGLSGAGTVAANNSYTIALPRIANSNASGATANAFASWKILFPNYAGGTYKAWSSDSAPENNTANSAVSMDSGLWKSTQPITALRFYNGAGLVEHSTITIYGISNIYDTAAPAAPTIGSVTDLGGSLSVAFTANDSVTGQRADSYFVESPTAGLKTFGPSSPIVVPNVSLGTSLQFSASAVNAVGTTTSALSGAASTDNSYSSIASVVTTSGQGVVFTNIPQNYKDLQIRIHGKAAWTSGGDSPILINFNADGGTRYTFGTLGGSGSGSPSTATFNNQNTMEVQRVPSATLNSNLFGSIVVDIPDYTNTSSFRSAYSYGGFEANSSSGTLGQVYLQGGMWNSYDTITTIAVTAYNGFAANSVISLYGQA